MGQYAYFLATFTSTQVLDAIFWAMTGDASQVPCNTLNYGVSRFVVPVVIFYQPIVLSYYPSKTAFDFLRIPYRLATVAGALLPMAFCKCTTLWMTTGMVRHATLLYGGMMPSPLLMQIGYGFWTAGAIMFARPWFVWRNIVCVGGLNLCLLAVLDGSTRLVSKLCFYCLLLSIVWLLEPLYAPPGADPEAAEDATGEPALPLRSAYA